VAEQEDVPNNLGLLFEAVFFETLSGAHGITVAAERMALQQQIVPAPFLRLPHVGHFMNEKVDVGLPFREIVGPEPALRVEVQVPAGRHHIVDRLQRPPG